VQARGGINDHTEGWWGEIQRIAPVTIQQYAAFDGDARFLHVLVACKEAKLGSGLRDSWDGIYGSEWQLCQQWIRPMV